MQDQCNKFYYAKSQRHNYTKMQHLILINCLIRIVHVHKL
jgi:hypothetical protein